MKDSLIPILATQFAMFTAVTLDIPIMRQIIGFVCISFIPGFLILQILRLNFKSGANTVLFSVGLSIAFLMFVGLFVNELYPLVGISKPLSTLPLFVSISTILFAMSFISYRKRNLTDDSFLSIPSLSQVLLASLLTGVPLLAIIGGWLTNSFLLLLMVAVISILVILIIFSKRLIPSELFSFVLLVIAVSLLLHRESVSNYFMGWDVFTEYHVFRITASNSLWNATIPFTNIFASNFNAMLSVTILPSIYSSLLNIQGEWVFRVIIPLLFSLVPIALYQVFQQQFGKPTAFLSAFYFITFTRFYTLGAARQMMGEIFLALLILLMVSKDIVPTKRQILLIIFGFSLIVSHYSLSYIYLFCISITWFFMSLIEKRKFTSQFAGTRRTISGGFVIFFFTMTLFWYIYVSISPFKTILNLTNNISSHFFADFLNPTARGETISEFVNPILSSLSLAYKIDSLVNKIPYFFIVVGIIDFFRHHEERRFEWEYAFMVAANASILLMVLVIPHLAPAFLVDRFYHVTLFFLAAFCILGGKTLFGWILRPLRARAKPQRSSRHVNLRPVCVLFVIIFLFKVGFVFEVLGDVPYSTSLSFTRMKASNDYEIKANFYTYYVPEQDVVSATWLSKVATSSKIYADMISSEKVLRSYGMVILEWKYILSNDSKIERNTYIYLRYLNVVDGVFIDPEGRLSNITGFSHVFNITNKIYSNGDSEIYRSLPSD
jgi:uncharacterized membrane protein